MSAARPANYTFVLKLTDRPGGMELVAATFAHRGVSLTSSLGNDGSLDPDCQATVLVTFTATPSKKEALKGALSRLSRVVSLVEHENGPRLRRAALVRFAPGAPPPLLPADCAASVERITQDKEAGDTYLLCGPADVVETALQTARADGVVRAVTQTVLAL